MTPDRIKELTLKRKLLADDPDSVGIVAQIDQLLRTKAKAKQPRRTADPSIGKTKPLARIPNGIGTELRVEVMRYSRFDRIDVRLWFVPDGGEEYIPSRKGVSIDGTQLPAIIAALQEARSFVGS